MGLFWLLTSMAHANCVPEPAITVPADGDTTVASTTRLYIKLMDQDCPIERLSVQLDGDLVEPAVPEPVAGLTTWSPWRIVTPAPLAAGPHTLAISDAENLEWRQNITFTVDADAVVPSPEVPAVTIDEVTNDRRAGLNNYRVWSDIDVPTQQTVFLRLDAWVDGAAVASAFASAAEGAEFRPSIRTQADRAGEICVSARSVTVDGNQSEPAEDCIRPGACGDGCRSAGPGPVSTVFLLVTLPMLRRRKTAT